MVNRRYLVLDEELHEVLSELNLLRKRVVIKVKQLFELRLDLNDHHTKESRGQLQRAVALRSIGVRFLK